MIYNKSTIETIEKDSNQFNDIYKLITKQLKTDLDYYKTGLSQFDIDNIKANDIVLEFVYNTKQKTKFLTDTREYYRLIMPLTGEYNDMFFFYDNTQHYMAPLGKLNSADSIIKLLNY